MSIADNVRNIRSQIAEAARSSGRNPEDILLCAATKLNSSENVRLAIAAGVDCCGENRVQELTHKMADNAYQGAPVHFIGHLQTNKVRQVVGKVDLIQSVDSIRLLQAIQSEAAHRRIVQDILLEINIGNEENKYGFPIAQIHEICREMVNFDNVRVMGFMTVPPVCRKNGENRKFFEEILQLSVDITAKKYDNVQVRFLSMGMSDDFRDAIACGSNMVRIGTAIFGPRDYS